MNHKLYAVPAALLLTATATADVDDWCCCSAACGTCEAVAKSITRLSAASVSETTASANSITKDTSAVAEARSVALELLLGAMSNLAPYSTEDVLEVRAAPFQPVQSEALATASLSCRVCSSV